MDHEFVASIVLIDARRFGMNVIDDDSKNFVHALKSTTTRVIVVVFDSTWRCVCIALVDRATFLRNDDNERTESSIEDRVCAVDEKTTVQDN
jgi:hypothetical protein